MSGNDGITHWPDLAALLRTRVSEGTWNTCFSTARPIVFDDHRLVLAVNGAPLAFIYEPGLMIKLLSASYA